MFTNFKYFHDGSYELTDVKFIDTGTGLERVLWLINGSPTSYIDMFPEAMKYL